MTLVRYNGYLISTMHNDGVVFDTSASVATLLSMQPYIFDVYGLFALAFYDTLAYRELYGQWMRSLLLFRNYASFGCTDICQGRFAVTAGCNRTKN